MMMQFSKVPERGGGNPTVGTLSENDMNIFFSFFSGNDMVFYLPVLYVDSSGKRHARMKGKAKLLVDTAKSRG